MTTFNRNPQFTPTGLTQNQLTRIERLADAIIARNNRPGTSWSKTDAEDEASWWMNSCRGGFGKQTVTALKVRAWFGRDDDAWNYLVNCIKWVIACGINRGKIQARSTVTNNRAYWAQVRGSY